MGKCLTLAFGVAKKIRNWCELCLTRCSSGTVISPAHELFFSLSLFLSQFFERKLFSKTDAMCEGLLRDIDRYSHHSRPPLHPHDGQRGISCPGTVEDRVGAQIHLQGLRFSSHAGADCGGQTSPTFFHSTTYQGVMSHFWKGTEIGGSTHSRRQRCGWRWCCRESW